MCWRTKFGTIYVKKKKKKKQLSPDRLYTTHREYTIKVMSSTAVIFRPPPPIKTGFIVSEHRLINITLLTLAQASSNGSRRPLLSLTLVELVFFFFFFQPC